MEKSMNSTSRQSRRSHFQRGAGIYHCRSCTRNTRGSGDCVSAKLCEQCFEIAGYDNQLNDSGEVATADERKLLNGYLAIIAERGGDAEAVRKFNEFAFPGAA
jgi:hypothetical protein